ncbi:MAG: sugar phosphate isomerase/epimerase [Prolixibacteraceae bacterium]|nr:sugar phosphate isomerase/epimerase [Prolixibacteraceae bacterium]
MNYEDYPIGIMQGRLSSPTGGKIQSFPKATWKDEFFKAKKAGLSHIEWIFEGDEWQKNPIISKKGTEEIRHLIGETGITIESVCADYFMDFPYMNANDNERKGLCEMLSRLVLQTKEIGGKYIDLPFVDASKINDRKEFTQVIEFISPALKIAYKTGVVIALETSLNPEDFKALLLSFGHPCLMANYDTGNSSSLGYDCSEELSAYGKWLRTVHIKDRKLNGGTVPLGTGDAHFNTFFNMLVDLDYKGPIVLQAAREGDEVETAMKNIRFVRNHLERSNC